MMDVIIQPQLRPGFGATGGKITGGGGKTGGGVTGGGGDIGGGVDEVGGAPAGSEKLGLSILWAN